MQLVNVKEGEMRACIIHKAAAAAGLWGLERDAAPLGRKRQISANLVLQGQQGCDAG